MFTVQDMMTPHPLFLSARDTIAQAKELMAKHGIRHLPIVDSHQHLLGLVTQRDILAAQESSLTHQSGGNRDSMMDTPLDAYTDRKLHSISPKGGLKEAAKYMQHHKIGCLPVVSNQKLVGIITDTDFVSIAITLLEIQEETEPLEEDE